MNDYRRGARPQPHRRKYIVGGIILCVLAAVIVLGFSASTKAPKVSDNQALTSKRESQPAKKPEKPQPPKVPLVDLQPTLDDWLKTQSAQYSIEVYDLSNHKVIAAHDPDTAFFTASLYKPYIAYFGYKKMTDGSFTDTPDYQNGRSRLQCLFVMIKNSDSPCGETMMAELGRPWIDTQLPALGMKCTSLVGLKTCAHDMNTLIVDFMNTKDIAEKYKQSLFKSMDEQIFRLAMEEGFDKAKFIGSKVGFNLDINYHETSLVTFADGRQYLVTIMSQGQGSPRPLRDLAHRFQAVLLEPQYAPSRQLQRPVYH